MRRRARALSLGARARARFADPPAAGSGESATRRRARADARARATSPARSPRSIASWYALVREHVVQTLSKKTGLQLKLSPGKVEKNPVVFCQIRAPMALLERRADALNYKLKLRPEVDPGREFWRKKPIDGDGGDDDYVEILEEAKVIASKDEANEVLEQLYQARKIGPNDMQVFEEDEPTAKHWSRRIHTLERIADRERLGDITNRYPAYAPFDAKPKERHLYEEYLSVRGKTLFLAKDRLFLTKRIFDEVFDFGVLVEKEAINSVMALHDANYGEAITVSWFQKRWVEFWRGESDRVGAPFVSHPAIEREGRCPCLFRPWAQPLMEIRAYFGEKVALYFAWLGFYGVALIVPSLVAGANYLYISLEDISPESKGFHPTLYVMAVFLVIWAACYKEEWDREQQICAVKWGTLGLEDAEPDRPQFVGDEKEKRRISPITNQKETYFPPEKRAQRQRFGLCVVFVFIVLLLGCVSFIFFMENLLAEVSWGSTVCSLMQSILIQVMSAIYAVVSTTLNDYENYRTETQYEDNLILKKFLFEMFNNYSAIVFTAFLKNNIMSHGCSSGNSDFVIGGGNCLADMKELLMSIFATRFLLAGATVVVPLISDTLEWISDHCCCCCPKAPDDDEDEDEGGMLDNTTEEEAMETGARGLKEGERFEEELKRDEYEGTFNDFAEIVLQMGYVTMFTLGWYLVPTLAMVEVLIQVRVDAYSMIYNHRRPFPTPAESIGMWGQLMEGMGLLAVYTNTAIICFTSRSLEAYNFETRMFIFFILEQAVLLMKVITHASIEDTPDFLEEIKKRQEFIVDKHKNVLIYDDDDGGDEDSAGKGNVDADALSIKKQATRRDMTLKQKAHVEWLRTRLRENTRDVKIARDQFKMACEAEVFREDTGVSESRKSPGLALGMVNLTVLAVENLMSSADDPIDAKNCRVIVQVRDNSKRGGYEGPPGPGAQVSKPGRLPKGAPKTSSTMEFNQQFSLAPIKTAHAELVIDIMDEKVKRKRGAAKLALQDLLSQKETRKTLSVQRKAKDGSDAKTQGNAVVYIKAQFQYSKVRPLKDRIYNLLEEQRKLQRDVTNLQLGKELEYTWPFPDANKDEDA